MTKNSYEASTHNPYQAGNLNPFNNCVTWR